MNNWVETTLSQVSEVKLCNVDKKTNKDEIEVRLCNYMDVYNNPFINADKVKTFMIATCSKSELDNFKIQEGQVAITKDSEKRDDIGISTYMAESFDDVVLGYHTALITPEKGSLSGKFLNYWFNTKFAKVYFENNAGGSGQRCTLPIDIIKSIPLKLPPIDLQEKIARIFYNIDSKIELNNRINAELESMAKTIYDYWFVQFDFPHEFKTVKTDKNGRRTEFVEVKPYKSSGGTMVWNEELKREIPEGWEVKELGSYATIKKGVLITEKTADVNGKIKVVSAGIDYSYFHSEANYPENTITISASGASAGYINFWREPIFACDCTTVRGKNTADTLQILGFLKIRQEFIYKQARGSAQPHVYPKDIEGLSYPIPPTSLVEKYGELVVSGNQQIAINFKQNQLLVSLRDWLLPMLMNGQITIK
jgi:type I restriction enzyme S subunit